jgi:hypothetical protein
MDRSPRLLIKWGHGGNIWFLLRLTYRVKASADRLTPYGGLAAWSHYLERVGIVTDLARRFPVERTSPNATPVGDILYGFMINALMDGRHFAHMRRLQDDWAVALFSGSRGRGCVSRIPS